MSRRVTGEKVVFITSSFNLEDLSYIIHYRENQWEDNTSCLAGGYTKRDDLNFLAIFVIVFGLRVVVFSAFTRGNSWRKPISPNPAVNGGDLKNVYYRE